MDILVTGAKGMLGKAIVSLLENEPGRHRLVAPARSELDLLDTAAVEQFIAAGHFDAVVHCAARLGSIQEHSNNQLRFLLDNARMGMNVIDAAQSHGVPRLVNIGTSAWYGRGGSEPSSEAAIARGLVHPDNEAYAWAKFLCLKLCQFATGNGLAYKTIIPCNLYGPGDKFSSASGHIIPAAIDKITRARHSGAGSVEIWGDGSALREFLYVGDLATLVAWSLECMETLPDFFNAGTGTTHSILQVYQTIAELMDYRGSFSFDLSRPAGSKTRVMNSDLIGQLGWRATTTLRDGLRQSIAFYEEHSDE